MKDHLNHYTQRIAVKAQINACTKCPLGESPHRVPFDGNTWSPDLIIMGEAPGANEALAHAPFVGPAGQLLDHCFEMARTSRDKMMLVNTVCCRPPGNRDPDWAETITCSDNRRAQTSLARTSFGLVLGRVPLSVMKNDAGIAIGKQIDVPFWADDVLWTPTYHPAYALRNAGATSIIVSSIRKALRYVTGEIEAPEDPSFPNYKVVDGMLVKKNEMSKVPQKIAEAWPVFLFREWVVFRHDPELVKAAKELRGQRLA